MDSRKITDPLNRGMVGGLLGVPAELGAMFLNGGRSIGNLANRLAGVNAPPAPMVENPVYGQEWWGDKMQKAGYVSPNRNKLAEFGAGLLDPGSVMTDVPMLAKGLFGLGDPATTKMLGGLLGATVWHGSPHKFDKFDSSKIGTGEGNQAYGHGLYLADNPTVAKNYQAKVSAMQGSGEPTIAGRAINWDSPQEAAAFEISRHNGDRAAAADFYARTFNNKKTEDLIRSGNDLPSVDLPGNLYKVDLPDEDIARMLDYDNAVPESVRQPLSKAALEQFGSGISMGQGSQLLKQVADEFKFKGHPNPNVAASEWLKSQGVPGIRYLDGGSRSTGQGSSNFVVFPGNENRLKILERNGKPVK